MPSSDITVSATYKPLPTYTLTVKRGNGSGDYSEGDTIAIETDPAPADSVFDQWTGDIETVDSPLNGIIFDSGVMRESRLQILYLS